MNYPNFLTSWKSLGFDIVHSISGKDSKFIFDSCVDKKPTKILEIGTGKGYSTYSLLAGSDCPVITVDKDPSLFQDASDYISLDRLVMHKLTDSTEYFSGNDDKDFDFMFIDASLRPSDISHIFVRSQSQFTVVLHDYWPDTSSGVVRNEKGKRNSDQLKNFAINNNYSWTQHHGGTCCVRLEFVDESV